MSRRPVDVAAWTALLMVVACLFALAPAASAERPPALDERSRVTDQGALPRFVSFRVSPAPLDGSRKQQLCLDVPIFLGVSLEGCGSGDGFLTAPSEPDLAHFRAKVPVGRMSVGGLTVVPGVVVGFAELQVGEDRAGFDFFGTGDGRTETAGPELGASVRFLERSSADTGGPIVVSELQLTVAYLPYAGELRVPLGEWFGSLEWTVGLGW